MVGTKIKRDSQDKTYVYLPAFLRDKFNLHNGEMVDVDTDGTKIIVTILKDTKKD